MTPLGFAGVGAKPYMMQQQTQQQRERVRRSRKNERFGLSFAASQHYRPSVAPPASSLL